MSIKDLQEIKTPQSNEISLLLRSRQGLKSNKLNLRLEITREQVGSQGYKKNNWEIIKLQLEFNITIANKIKKINENPKYTRDKSSIRHHLQGNLCEIKKDKAMKILITNISSVLHQICTQHFRISRNRSLDHKNESKRD